jgi:mannose-1-phosphate guanylyltransferase/mannose-6-phosphate isomerase
MPKQFLPFLENRTLFREALNRVSDRSRFSSPVVVGSLRHADLCERELEQEDNRARLILEPCARNTAAAIAMAAIVVSEEQGGDALLLVMPSDHVIDDVPAFHAAVEAGEAAARAGRLVTFGIRPTGPETGYGYLQMGAELTDGPGALEVARFVEKPPLDVAKAMLEGGDHLWNAGIFLMKARAFVDELSRVAPEILRAATEAVRTGTRDGIQVRPSLEALAHCPSESVDFAVMEKSSRVAVVPMSPGWSDLGCWDALADLLEGGESGPVTIVDCDNCYIRSDGLQIAALGIQDMIVVASGQRLLILPRGRSQEVKRLLSAMESLAA